MPTLDEIKIKLLEKAADQKAPKGPDGSTPRITGSVDDLIQRIKQRSDTKASQNISNDWGVIQVDGFETAFYVRTWAEKGQEAMKYLMTNALDVEVITADKSSNYTVVFKNSSDATYFKLKYIS